LFDTDPAMLGAGARPGAHAVAHAGWGLGRASLLPFPTSPGWRTRRNAFFGLYMHVHVSAG
jgi:hypothetical protein